MQVWLDELIANGEKMMLQPYLETVETDGEYSAIYFGQNLSHCVQKIPVPGDYRVQDDYGASDHGIDPDDYPDMMRLAERTLQYLHARFSDVLVTRMDFLQLDNGAFVINEVEMIEPSFSFVTRQRDPGQLLLEELLSLHKRLTNRL